MLAVSGGKNFQLGKGHRWFLSGYTGGGFLTIGEPRLIDISESVIRQVVSRKGSVFGKLGTRLGYKTMIKFLQTIYFDGSYWGSPLTIQGSTLSGVSLFLGIRMSMN